MGKPQIIAMGGGVLNPDEPPALERAILAATGKTRPSICYVPTAGGDSDAYLTRFYATYAKLDCRASHLPFFRRTPADLAAFTLAHDAIHVGGGNTRSMLAVWREWGFDAILRDAWQRGIVLCGSSAGAICWFEEGVTDSIAGSLTRMPAMGFLQGSFCPHYDGESERRPAYHQLMAAGLIGDGYAADDGVGLHFVGTSLQDVIIGKPGAHAYRVERRGDTVVETSLG